MCSIPAVDPSTMAVILKLQSKDYLKGFYLVGGTALALKIGHRRSIDIDLFTATDFDTSALLENLMHDFGFRLFFSSKNTLKGSIEDVKTDFLAHRYPFIREPELLHGILMLSEQDIIAMKLNAIVTSGQRVKDFIDICFLLKKYSISEMLSFYRRKYTLNNDALVLKSLVWFNDIDLSDWPVLLKNPELKWTEVKRKITKAVRNFLQSSLRS